MEQEQGIRFLCSQRRIDGTLCNRSFVTQGNLKRHTQVHHVGAAMAAPPKYRFVHVIPRQVVGADGDVKTELEELPQPQENQGCVGPSLGLPSPSRPSLPHLQDENPRSLGLGPPSLSRSPTPPSSTGSAPASPQMIDSPHAKATEPTPPSGLSDGRDSDQEYETAREACSADESEEDSYQAGKRQRLSRGIYQAVMPAYRVKLSRKVPGQLKAVSWLTDGARQRLHRRIEGIMASWGVKPEHAGTCLLVPVGWEFLAPTDVLSNFSFDNCPRADAGRLLYKDFDHSTTFARALAWFGSGWPRNGIQLDNFLECGPFQRMDGSHLCHHSLCINPHHIVFDRFDLNQDRIRCYHAAKSTRRDGFPVPACCTEHQPPCLLQHAALSTYEAFLVQMWVLERSTSAGNPADNHAAPAPAPQRPRWHTLPTFEYGLPLKFCPNGDSAVELRSEHIHRPAPDATRRVSRPPLVCPFCPTHRAFASVVAYWGHLFHRHYDRLEAERLREVRSSARTWQEYWTASIATPGAQDPTRLKIQQALQDDFT